MRGKAAERSTAARGVRRRRRRRRRRRSGEPQLQSAADADNR
jgi:hypothetical protein